MNIVETVMKFPIFSACAISLAMSIPAQAADIVYDYATVVDATPLFNTVRISTPREECWDERVPHYRNHHNGRNNDALGSVLGGVIGGAIGNEVGNSKKNKQVGAVVGAIVGSKIGKSIANSNGKRHEDVSYTTEEVCRVYQDYHEEERVIGYSVRYRYNDETYTTRMKSDPGETIKLRLSISPVR